MKLILFSAMISLLAALGITPFVVRWFRARGFGQLLREDWHEQGLHAEKRGTPTMGGVVIVVSMLLGYLVAHLLASKGSGRPGWSGILVIGTMFAMSIVGFIDDYTKIRHQRSLGLNKTAKTIGQAVVAVGFALAARHFAHASDSLSFVRDTALHFGPFFALWVFLMMSATTNGVNLTDGLDGLAAGASAFVFAAYIFIGFWVFRHPCSEFSHVGGCYNVRADPLDLALVAAAGLGACAGFLWWNAAPAKIFMGDTGALGLGGALASLAILTSTQLLLVVLGGLFVLETTSVIMQIIAFHGFKRRVFRMAPLHHHFELGGWPEFTVIVRFWIVAGLAAALGLGLFYADFLGRGGAR